MNCSKVGAIIVESMFCIATALATEIPSEQEFAEIRSQRFGAEMRAKAMQVIAKIWKIRSSSAEDDKCELDTRLSNAFLEAPPKFGAENVSLTLRTQFLNTMPGFDALQPDTRLWDALAKHLLVASSVPQDTLDGKMSKAKEEDERLIADGKITRPPCHFGYPTTPNMARVQREKWAVEKWNADIAPYRLALLKKYAPLLAKFLKRLDEMQRTQFQRRFSKRACLTQEEELRFFGTVSDRRNANANAHRQEALK